MVGIGMTYRKESKNDLAKIACSEIYMDKKFLYYTSSGILTSAHLPKSIHISIVLK